MADKMSKSKDGQILTDGDARELMEVEEPDAGLRFWPVRTLVNSIKNNGPELIEPVEIGEPETLF